MGDHLEDTRGDTKGSPDVFVERIAIFTGWENYGSEVNHRHVQW